MKLLLTFPVGSSKYYPQLKNDKLWISEKDYFAYHYHRSDSDKKLVFVFVHGLGGQKHQFSGLIKLLEDDGYSTLAFDQLGCGHSSKNRHPPSMYSSEGLAKASATVIDKVLPADAPVILVGHSMGCVVVSRLYPLCKERCKGVVLLGPKSHVTAMNKKRIQQVLKLPHFALNLMRLGYRLRGSRSSSVENLVALGCPHHLRLQQWLWNKHSDTYTWKWSLAGMGDISHTYLKVVTCPVLLVAGTQDRATPKENALAVKAHLVHTKHVYHEFECGHMIMIERLQETYEKVYEFVTEIER
ncbi:carboxylic ester hydrolase activity [Schizosaccharomyces japonicus yFS275]|uniref:Carboxylic ester hydrolase activity n=1 Tax=Schizosaccharomyces japonicus (strain yFS275 / FY16936) TaxID=402676 RepID=B6K4P2_SCHJY|nr:carboxylic ester hydrolase activity [Schizosaccharomyces japonicus yFS275]EEB08449.1 carboxylic ester hydrolase activity [Schizosaccharomyces japonicus yFS275]